MVRPTPRPEVVRLVAEPGEILEPIVVIDRVPQAAAVQARIEGGAPGMTLVRVTVTRPVRTAYTPEEILELPPKQRAAASERGYVNYEEVGTSDGTTPVQAGFGDRVVVVLRFSAAPGVPETSSGKLWIEGSTWEPVPVDLSLVIAKLSFEILDQPFKIGQGGDQKIRVRVTSVAGPTTHVRIALTDSPDWVIPPHVGHVPRGATVTELVTLRVFPSASVGDWTPAMSVSGFDGLYLRTLWFKLKVVVGHITVLNMQQGALAIIQGRRAAWPIRLSAAGFGADVVFQPKGLPPGIVMPAQTRTAGLERTTDVTLDIDALPNAPLHNNESFALDWSAPAADQGGTLSNLRITVVPHEVKFSELVTTPPGTALGGLVEMFLRSDGSYTFTTHMHGSGFDSYAFRVVALVRTGSGAAVIAAQTSGTVGGTIGGGSRDFDAVENGANPAIAGAWDDVRRGSMSVIKSYDDTGVLGALGDIASAAVDWMVASALAGPMIASAYVLGRELGNLSGVRFGPPNVLAGLAAKEGVVLIFGPHMVFWAMVAGVASGLALRQRGLTQAERDFADRVFHGTIDYDRVVLINASRGSRKFTIPHVDGRALIGMGEFYDNPTTGSNSTYPAPGQTFIHELVHAWQIAHHTFLTEVFWKAAKNGTCELIGENPYTLPSPLPSWSSLNLEQQASAVDQWYGRHKAAINVSSPTVLTDGPALADMAFPLISGNLWTGET
jgi:hypothetical protein